MLNCFGLPDFQIVASAAHSQSRDHHQNHGTAAALLRLFWFRVGIRVHSGGLAGTVLQRQNADRAGGIDLAGSALVRADADRFRVRNGGHVIVLQLLMSVKITVVT